MDGFLIADIAAEVKEMDVTLTAYPGVSNDTIHKILHGDLGL